MNLSWNSLFEEEKVEYERVDGDELDWYLKAKFNLHNTTVMELLSFIIKKNKSLLHLDLDAIGLTEVTLCQIGKFLRRSKSLLSIHLSFNPGTNSNTI